MEEGVPVQHLHLPLLPFFCLMVREADKKQSARHLCLDAEALIDCLACSAAGEMNWSTQEAPTRANAQIHTACCDDMCLLHRNRCWSMHALEGALLHYGASWLFIHFYMFKGELQTKREDKTKRKMLFPYLENNFLKVKLTLNQRKLNINLMMMSPTMCPKMKTCHSFFHDLTEMKMTG